MDRIEGNLIVHNWYVGVGLFDGTINQVIGGNAAGAGNTIAYNGFGVSIGRQVGGQPPIPSIRIQRRTGFG